MAQQDSGGSASRRRTSGTGREESHDEPRATRPRGEATSRAKQTKQPSQADGQRARRARAPAQPRARRKAGEPAHGPQPQPQIEAQGEAVASQTAEAADMASREEVASASRPEAQVAAAEEQAAEALAPLTPATAEEALPAASTEAPNGEPLRRRDRRASTTNALGIFIERQFANPTSPCHSYSDLERHSGISREALSRYVTSRVDRRRSPTIDTLVAIADALHVGLEPVARAAAASVKGVIPPPEEVQYHREEVVSSLIAALTDAQFDAVVELLRQMHPPVG